MEVAVETTRPLNPPHGTHNLVSSGFLVIATRAHNHNHAHVLHDFPDLPQPPDQQPDLHSGMEWGDRGLGEGEGLKQSAADVFIEPSCINLILHQYRQRCCLPLGLVCH